MPLGRTQLRDRCRREARWLTIAGVVGLVAAIAVSGVTRGGGRHGAGASSVPSAGASSVPSAGASSVPSASASPDSERVIQIQATSEPSVALVLPMIPTRVSVPAIPAAPQAAPGTVLLTCDSVVWGQPDPNWQAGSLRVGTMWLVDRRHLGYVRLGRTRQAADGPAGHGAASRDVEMLVHVGAGSTVVMRAAAGESPYFEFLNSPGSTGDLQGADGGRGFTFVRCSAPDLGYGGSRHVVRQAG